MNYVHNILILIMSVTFQSLLYYFKLLHLHLILLSFCWWQFFAVHEIFQEPNSYTTRCYCINANTWSIQFLNIHTYIFHKQYKKWLDIWKKLIQNIWFKKNNRYENKTKYYNNTFTDKLKPNCSKQNYITSDPNADRDN